MNLQENLTKKDSLLKEGANKYKNKELLKKFPLLKVLNKGKENAITSDNLCNYFRLKNKRSIYEEVRRERLKGLPVLAHLKTGGGYYLPESETEYEDYLDNLNKRINSQIQIKEKVESLKSVLF